MIDVATVLKLFKDQRLKSSKVASALVGHIPEFSLNTNGHSASDFRLAC